MVYCMYYNWRNLSKIRRFRYKICDTLSESMKFNNIPLCYLEIMLSLIINN